MQQGFTPSFKTQILKYFFFDHSEEVPQPTPLFVGLFVDQGSAEPNELVIGKNGYQRAEAVFETQTGTGVVRNVNAITFPTATQDWTSGLSKITHIGIFKSQEIYDEDSGEMNHISDTTDEMIAFIQLPEAETVVAGETFQFNPQAITLQLI